MRGLLSNDIWSHSHNIHVDDTAWHRNASKINISRIKTIICGIEKNSTVTLSNIKRRSISVLANGSADTADWHICDCRL